MAKDRNFILRWLDREREGVKTAWNEFKESEDWQEVREEWSEVKKAWHGEDFFVGIDISPGVYRCDEPGSGGWWQIVLGPDDDHIVSSGALGKGPAEVEIEPNNYIFSTSVEGEWKRVGDSVPNSNDPGDLMRPVAHPDFMSDMKRLHDRKGRKKLDHWFDEDAPLCELWQEDFDDEAASLLIRAQNAVDTVLGSKVNKEGLLDSLDNALVLPQQLWEIAQVLSRHTELRDEQEELGFPDPEQRRGEALQGTPSPDASPEVEAAMRPLRKKLELSVQAVTRRIEALERYADRARVADETWLTHERVETISAHGHKYDDLVAETVRDDLAIPVLEQLTEHGDQSVQILRERLEAATRAGSELAGLDLSDIALPGIDKPTTTG